MLSIADLPIEIIERIFSNLNSYNDLETVKLVSRLWYRHAISLADIRIRDFHKFAQFSWFSTKKDGPASRHSHLACYLNELQKIFVFGGSSSANASFNDIWALDMNTLEWSRASLKYNADTPMAKSLAVMIPYKGNIILHGGSTKYANAFNAHPLLIPQRVKYSQELHIFDTKSNIWKEIIPKNKSRSVAGHSACIVHDTMIVFGGIIQVCEIFKYTNDVWTYNFIENVWKDIPIKGVMPKPRFHHSMTLIDENHILIHGGACSKTSSYFDTWILNFNLNSENDWSWKKVEVRSTIPIENHTWCYPTCVVGSKLISLECFYNNVCCRCYHQDLKPNAPNYLMYYSICAARGEIVIFGGLDVGTSPVEYGQASSDITGTLKICEITSDLRKELREFRFKQNRSTNALILKIDPSSLLIKLDRKLEDCDPEIIREELPTQQPRFIVVSYERSHDDGRISYPMCLIFYSPSGCNPNIQMMYAGSRNNLARECELNKNFEIREPEELTAELLESKLF